MSRICYNGYCPNAEKVTNLCQISNTFCPAYVGTIPKSVHEWFGLTYAQYLTVPRSILEAMSIPWQDQFVKLMEELDTTYDWHPKEGEQYSCSLHNPKYDSKGMFASFGKAIPDPLGEYRHPDYKYIESLLKGDPK